MIYRLYSGVHTFSQVAAGALVGSAFGAFWFLLGHRFVAPILFPIISSLPIAKYFYVRDSTNVPNVLAVEYDACNNAAAAQKKKL
jgi:dolichyldiphosphatase